MSFENFSIRQLQTLILGSVLCFFCSTVSGQKGFFEEVNVEAFSAPYEELVIIAYGTEQTVNITPKTKFRGHKNKKLEPSQLEEGTLVIKLSYELIGEDYVATVIDSDISADGSVRISGLYEGISDGMPVVDGFPIKLLPGVSIVGENGLLKKKTCDCSGLAIPKFDHPLLRPGEFYVNIQGTKDEAGVIHASEVKLCRNTFAKPERELLAAVNNNLSNNTEQISHIPTGIYNPPMGLYQGQIQVGQYSYPLTDNIELQGYINQVGYRLLPEHAKNRQINGEPVSYRFYVINDPIPNAFAFPNGMIFIHTGLLEIIENEAQLAIVLGHEIAHVTHEHGRERYTNTNLVKTGEVIYNKLFKRSLRKKFYTIAPSLSPEVLSTITTVSANITPSAISNIIKPQTQMESQADRVGLFYAYEAGYDIREAASFWNKMEELTGSQDFQNQVTSQLVSMLKSDRFDFGSYGQNPLQQLSAAGLDVLAKQFLNTIYTSHPKAKKRAKAVDKLVSTVYADTVWDEAQVKKNNYLARVGR